MNASVVLPNRDAFQPDVVLFTAFVSSTSSQDQLSENVRASQPGRDKGLGELRATLTQLLTLRRLGKEEQREPGYVRLTTTGAILTEAE